MEEEKVEQQDSEQAEEKAREPEIETEIKTEIETEDAQQETAEEAESEPGTTGDGLSVDDFARLDERIKDLEEENEKYYQKLLRLQSDFVNFRKRVNKEKQRIGFNTRKEVILELLPVIDNFERALKTDDSGDDFRKGIDMIYRQLVTLLGNQGIEVIPTTGEHFDHNLHEAMLQVEDDDYQSGVIIEELQKGYLMEGEVIRPALVKVAK